MSLSLNGNLDVVRVLRSKGLSPQWATKWLTPHLQTNSDPLNPTWNTNEIDEHLDSCRTEGVGAHFQFFYFGDELVEDFFTGDETWIGPSDYNGKKQTLKAAWNLLWVLSNRVKTKGVPVLLNLETEWNKGTAPNASGLRTPIATDAGSVAFDQTWAAWARRAKEWSGGLIRIVSSPGQWSTRYGDVGATLLKFPNMVREADYIGTQCLRSIPGGKHANGKSYLERAAHYDEGPDALLRAVESIAVKVPGKKYLVTDFFFSTYGGEPGTDFHTNHPFEPINGRTEETNGLREEERQRRAFERLFVLKPRLEALGVEAIFTRAINDVPGFNVKNYHGYAERHYGVVRKDGVQKPGYEVLLLLGNDIVAQLRRELNETISRLDAERARADTLASKLARVRATLEE